ncbi:sugar ABC transporter permease [bacterium]|nr:sugar ABC transporter permease [bacterium]
MRKLYLHPFLFVLPWLLTFIVFWLYPFVFSLYLSFTDYSLLNTASARSVGIAHYEKLFSDPLFWTALKNTIIFCIVTIPFTIAFSVLLANAIHLTKTLKSFIRTSVFVPSIVSVTVIALIFIQFYAHDGYLSLLAQFLGLDVQKRGLLLNDQTALLSIMMMDILVSTGYYAVLFLAAIQNIPADLFENAELAGANAIQKFWHITLPQLRPMILFALVINTIKSFQIFTEIFMMTKGGPLYATTTMIYRIYELGFRDFQMGYASAMAYVLLLIIGIFAWLQIRLLKAKETS